MVLYRAHFPTNALLPFLAQIRISLFLIYCLLWIGVLTLTKSFKSILLFFIFEDRKTIVPFLQMSAGLYVNPIFAVPIDDNLTQAQLSGISNGISSSIFFILFPFFS